MNLVPVQFLLDQCTSEIPSLLETLPLSLASLAERLGSESESLISGDNIGDALASEPVRKKLIQAVLVLSLLCVEAFCFSWHLTQA